MAYWFASYLESRYQVSLYTDVVSFYFSFFSKTSARLRAKRVRENKRTTPLRWRSITPLQFIFYHPRSTDFEEKIEGLRIG